MTARVAALLVGIASSVIVARALGPIGKGEYTLIVLIPTLLQFIGGLGLDHAITYRVARQKGRARSIALTLSLATLSLGVALVIVYAGVAALPPYRAYLDAAGIDPLLIWLLVGLLPFTLAYQSVLAAIIGLEWYRAYNAASLVSPIVNLVALIALVVLFAGGVMGAVAAAATASSIGLLVAGTIFFRNAPGEMAIAPGEVREAVSYGMRVHVANVAWFVHYRADMFLVGFIAGPGSLGYYATAVGLAEKLYLAPSAVGTVLFPRVAASDDRGGGAKELTPRACRHTFWLTLALGAALAAIARPLIVALFGARFLPSASPLWLLIPGVVSLSVGRLLSADLNGRGLPGTVARANLSMAVANVALNLWWIPIWGIMGAAAATSLSYSAAVLLLARRYTRVSNVGWMELVRFDKGDLRAISRRIRSLLDRRESAPSS